MSRYDNIMKKYIVYLSLLTSSAVFAGVSEPETKSGEQAYQLRCWQYGRLILEENNWGMPSEMAGQVLHFKGRGEGKVALYLMDYKNATCMLKKERL